MHWKKWYQSSFMVLQSLVSNTSSVLRCELDGSGNTAKQTKGREHQERPPQQEDKDFSGQTRAAETIGGGGWADLKSLPVKRVSDGGW